MTICCWFPEHDSVNSVGSLDLVVSRTKHGWFTSTTAMDIINWTDNVTMLWNDWCDNYVMYVICLACQWDSSVFDSRVWLNKVWSGSGCLRKLKHAEFPISAKTHHCQCHSQYPAAPFSGSNAAFQIALPGDMLTRQHPMTEWGQNVRRQLL